MADETEDEGELYPSFTTARGNTITMETHNPFGFLRIKFLGGGELPDMLKGNFTGTAAAVTAIQSYLLTVTPLRADVEDIKKPPVLKIKSEAATKSTATRAKNKVDNKIEETSIFNKEPVESGENLSS
jgi:hypothetical protein